ncbi:MAG: radical SAM protein [Polyangia bacterium]
MSSLGYQVVYRLLNQLDPDEYGVTIRAERAFCPEDVAAWQRARLPLVTYESLRPVGQQPAILFSVAYELELTGLFSCLELAGVPVLREERGPRHPLVICGGPLTFSNPLPLGPFADIVVMGEAEEVLPRVVRALVEAGAAMPGGLSEGRGLGDAEKAALLRGLARTEGLWIPAVHGEALPKVAQCDDALLPASSAILSPNTELRSMFLVEPERGCSRGCTYCVMRRSTNGGMRLVPPERLFALLPRDITRVGLVGAAVTDHPKLPQILRHIVDERGLEVGISSLRADRLTDEIVGLLGRGGYRTLTVASDGASERMREIVERRTKERHLLRAAQLAAAHGMKTLKVYMVVGLPGETDDDLDELVRFTRELAAIVPTALGVAPFVAKRNTPLDGSPFAGIAEVDRKLARVRKGLGRHAEVRPTSARWAWVEYVLAQGGMDAGLRALSAHRDGGSFGAWRRAFAGFTPRQASPAGAGQAPVDDTTRLAPQRLSLPVL